MLKKLILQAFKIIVIPKNVNLTSLVYIIIITYSFGAVTRTEVSHKTKIIETHWFRKFPLSY